MPNTHVYVAWYDMVDAAANGSDVVAVHTQHSRRSITVLGDLQPACRRDV